MHLLVEEVNHFLLREPEGDVANVDSPGLAGDGGADNGDSCLEIQTLESDPDIMLMTLYLRCVRHQGGGDLAALLHALVLHRRDVLKPRGRHIPVQTGLAPLGRLLSSITTVPGSGPSTCDTMTPRILFFCSVLTSEKKTRHTT